MALSNCGPVQEVVIGAATHALIVSGGRSPRVPFGQRDLDELPRVTVERALQALRIPSDATFGYAQMVVRPNGWASRYKTTLPPLEYANIERRYPPAVDNFGWLEVPETITQKNLNEARTIYETLQLAPTRIRQAARRIDRSQMREDLDDAVVDYCIGLESLLDDSTHTETTHKCALRAATVLAITDNLSPEVVVKVVKKAYALRSAIVHGHPDDNLSKLRTIKLGDNEYNTAFFVRFVLHRLVSAMLADDRWTDPAEIDRRLLAAVRPVSEVEPDTTATP